MAEHDTWNGGYCGTFRTHYRLTLVGGGTVEGRTTLSADEVEALVKSMPIDIVLLEVKQA